MFKSLLIFGCLIIYSNSKYVTKLEYAEGTLVDCPVGINCMTHPQKYYINNNNYDTYLIINNNQPILINNDCIFIANNRLHVKLNYENIYGYELKIPQITFINSMYYKYIKITIKNNYNIILYIIINDTNAAVISYNFTIKDKIFKDKLNSNINIQQNENIYFIINKVLTIIYNHEFYKDFK